MGCNRMRRRFNITGFCNPQRHYMIKLGDRLKKIKEDYIDEGHYFVINRGRQYGKTTTLVLMIDEVVSAGNNQIFIDFLSQLRSYYLNRDKTSIFHSVVLAEVYSIKNLKLKIRPESDHQYNSPWNIAADFDIENCRSSCIKLRENSKRSNFLLLLIVYKITPK